MLFKSQKTGQKFNPDYWRDHSANERTYLSWMRASIALMGFGLVILRLRTVSSPSNLLLVDLTGCWNVR